MGKIKIILVCLGFFGAGFLTHVYLVKDKVPPPDPRAVEGLMGNQKNQDNKDEFVSYVEFDGEKFSPSSVGVVLGNYLAITNKHSSKLMWLSSNNQLLRTSRGYGEGERLLEVMSEKGSFTVVANNEPKSSLVVIVE